jgi:hypothetical protein
MRLGGLGSNLHSITSGRVLDGIGSVQGFPPPHCPAINLFDSISYAWSNHANYSLQNGYVQIIPGKGVTAENTAREAKMPSRYLGITGVFSDLYIQYIGSRGVNVPTVT